MGRPAVSTRPRRRSAAVLAAERALAAELVPVLRETLLMVREMVARERAMAAELDRLGVSASLATMAPAGRV